MHWQWDSYRRIKESLPKNDILLIMDFSENIPVEFCEETIASHSKSFGLTLFPVCLYQHVNNKIEMEAIVFVSDDTIHDSHLVRTFTDKVMEHIRVSYPEKKIHAVHRFSDGASS